MVKLSSVITLDCAVRNRGRTYDEAVDRVPKVLYTKAPTMHLQLGCLQPSSSAASVRPQPLVWQGQAAGRRNPTWYPYNRCNKECYNCEKVWFLPTKPIMVSDDIGRTNASYVVFSMPQTPSDISYLEPCGASWCNCAHNSLNTFQ